MTRPCRVCGCLPSLDISDGVLRDLRVLLGPKWRWAARTGRQDWTCYQCALWAARIAGVIR